MDKRELQANFHEHLPLSKAMGIEVVDATYDAVTLSAPLAPNVNHQGTVFAGSALSVGLLAAWTLLSVRLQSESLDNCCVVASNTMTYYQPITGTFTATAVMIDTIGWQRFTNTLKQNKRARVVLTSTVHCKGEKVGELECIFVASGE